MKYENGFFYSASQFYKEKFGCKVYKLSLDAGCTCPNRDGTKAYGGCIFCSQSGSGDFAAKRSLSIKDQVMEAKSLVKSKVKDGKYIAYFQNFSNTYGDIKELEGKYQEALMCEGVLSLSIATRPDCITQEVLEVFSRLSKKTFLIVELGLQTSNEETGKYIRRYYSNEDYSSAIKALKQLENIHVVTHIIFGLPSETEIDMMNTVDFTVRERTDGIKISTLHVLKNTDLYEEYLKGKVPSLEMEEYFSLIGKALLRIPENIVIHRLTGDGAKKILVSPLWTQDKKKVLNSMNAYFKENQIVQGRDFLYN